ncbi:MAG: 2-oxoacid:acceptor oxidoreductase subunit alpha [Candidatus Acidulodesulfobacterium ferriphilum]|uniref:2-oxoacid:acceptor oxidoreductase subunit alpha n=1 Tax=Candidatus Acidulodesulfobacterium ferriphilum TaxID=2597223 RepID=A0A519BDS6_9DELT|nr:2-oxoacid:acceptor oxidoreductase subunit alpha [Deltaproteobacteria bacterium]RZD15397.1 MAG: 2-oxoacid:acceptor oxidoreductase subunit alpha [Candidatus Acidulodesulfobacterium ferriphilum]
MTKNIKLMQGNEAIAEGAVIAGCDFFAGYPITPSSEVAEILSSKLPKIGRVFLQMEDEIAALGAVLGAALGGAKAITASSGPGISLKQEHIGYASMCEIPCVIINVMRGGPSTGLPTLPAQGDVMQAKWGTHGDHAIIAITPSSVNESLYETIRAFNLAVKYRTPVLILTDEIIGHMREKVVIPDKNDVEIIDVKLPGVPPEKYNPYNYTSGKVTPLAPMGEGYRYHVTGLIHGETGFPSQKTDVIQNAQNWLMDKIYKNIKDIEKFEEFQTEDADILLVAYGSTSRSSRQAIRMARSAGIKAGMFRPITIWPFPDEQVSKLSKKIKKILVPEMNMGQIIFEVQRNACGSSVYGLNVVSGEPITPDQIYEKIKEISKI